MSILKKNKTLNSLFETYGSALAEFEETDTVTIASKLENGRAVILTNPYHNSVKPIIIGEGFRVKVNANIGTSGLDCSFDNELKKLDIAVNAGADTVMDLSTSGDLNAIRREILARTHAPIGTVPLYAVAEKYISNGVPPEEINMDEIFDEIEREAKQGVDFMTIHTGLDMNGARLAQSGDRALGIVSRGGSLLARWMLKNDKENPFLTGFDKILEIARAYNITLSLGDGLRPGALSDAGDAAQWSEVIHLAAQAKRALDYGVQSMIEGPGHVSLDLVDSQIRSIKRLTNYAPLYILGPLVIDNSPGYDHISGAIGASIAVMAGADFLCYLTPAEHLELPNADDVKNGVVASKIAATAGEVALKRPWALLKQAAMSSARSRLDWHAMKANAIDKDIIDKRRLAHQDKDECAMCGEFCSVKMNKEVQK